MHLKIGQRWLHKPDNTIMEILEIKYRSNYEESYTCHIKRLTGKDFYKENRCLIPENKLKNEWWKYLPNQDKTTSCP
jgi:hypothetical protein